MNISNDHFNSLPQGVWVISDERLVGPGERRESTRLEKGEAGEHVLPLELPRITEKAFRHM